MRKLLIVYLILVFVHTVLLAQNKPPANPDPHRFDKEINAFIMYDQKNSFPENAILFVGSSSIRIWKTHLAFPEFPVINRGFGGAHISDVLFFYDQIVKKYQPQIIVFYAGDNDIAAGKPVDQVVSDFKKFVQKVKSDLPSIRIIYLPIKPSILRWKFWPAMDKANQIIKSICLQDELLEYIDTAGALLAAGGQPDKNLFISDGLHLNAKGYQKWNAILLPVLQKKYK